jgi:hypothetical protein
MATETQPEAHRETDGRPVEPTDYMKLNAVYGVLLLGTLAATHRRVREEPLEQRELIPIAMATFALAKVVAREKIGTWMREPFVEVENGERRPRGTHLRRAIGELVTCTRCVGAWSALAVVGLRAADPATGKTVTNVLAASAANDWMQSGFKWLCAQTNQAQAEVP